MPASLALSFGIVPHVDDDKTRRAFGEICERLGAQIGEPVKPFYASTPMALGYALGDGTVQIGWSSPTLLFEAPLADVIPILTSDREGSDAYHAAIFVSRSSAIHEPAQLKGKTIAWVARTSAAGYIVPRLALAQKRMNPRTLFGRELFLSSHGAVARAVFEGRADAGATYVVFAEGNPARSVIRAGFRDFVPDLSARIIVTGGPIPADMIVVTPSVEPARRERIAEALTRFAQDPEATPALAKVIGADRFRRFSEESRKALADLVANVRRYGL